MSAIKTPKVSMTTRFCATMRREGSGERSAVPLPAELSEEFTSEAPTMVEGTMDGFPFRAPVEKGAGGFELRLSEPLLRAVGADAGDSVSVEITRIGDEPEVRAPIDLLEALARAPKAQELWAKVTPMARREWVRWIASAKQQETRERRIEVGIDKLSKGMRRPCCFPGLNWVTKDLVSSEETWSALPGSKGGPKG